MMLFVIKYKQNQNYGKQFNACRHGIDGVPQMWLSDLVLPFTLYVRVIAADISAHDISLDLDFDFLNRRNFVNRFHIRNRNP